MCLYDLFFKLVVTSAQFAFRIKHLLRQSRFEVNDVSRTSIFRARDEKFVILHVSTALLIRLLYHFYFLFALKALGAARRLQIFSSQRMRQKLTSFLM